MLYDPFFYLCAVPAILLMGLSKGGFGGGLGGFSLPLLLLVMPPLQAAAIMLPLLCLADLTGFKAYYGKWSWRILRIILPGAVVGTLIGWVLFEYLPAALMLVLIGLISAGYALYQLFGLSKRTAEKSRGSQWQGWFWSGVSGVTSFVAHAGGPPLQIYMLPLRLPKETFIATTNLFFLLVNLIKLGPYFLLGQFSSSNLWLCVVLAPCVPIGVYSGIYLQRRVDINTFYMLLQVFLFLTGSLLIYQGLRSL